jgi:RsiW-degrading membrane proteinase PrsW (M82 family)
MLVDLLTRAPVGLLPVLIFLIILLYMDSYKLVGFRTVLWVITAGSLLPVAGYWINGSLITELGWELSVYSRYAAPFIEEGLKACVMVFLFRTNRIGFLVDAAILGFAVGAGFGVVENFYYLYMASDAHIAVWIVRGFGTAIMHGAVMALFGVMAQTFTERSMKINPLLYMPGFIVAIVIQAYYAAHTIVCHLFQGIFVDSWKERIVEVIISVLVYHTRECQDISRWSMCVGDEEKGAAPDASGHTLHDQETLMIKLGPGSPLPVGLKGN